MRILAVAITRMLINVHTYYIKHTRVGLGLGFRLGLGLALQGMKRRAECSGGVQRRAEGAPGADVMQQLQRVCGWQGGTAPCLASR